MKWNLEKIQIGLIKYIYSSGLELTVLCMKGEDSW
jgi:hypothetical protein